MIIIIKNLAQRNATLTAVLVAVAARLVLRRRRIGGTARHALVVEAVEVQRIGARDARVLAGAGARAARLVARVAAQRRPVVELAAQALHAQAALQHEVRRTGGAGERTGGCAQTGGEKCRRRRVKLCLRGRVELVRSDGF